LLCPVIDRRAMTLFATVLLPVLSAACSDGVAESNGEPERETCEALSGVGDLPAALAEASGIARDPRRDDLFWLHNDSGNPTGIRKISRLRAARMAGACITATSATIRLCTTRFTSTGFHCRRSHPMLPCPLSP